MSIEFNPQLSVITSLYKGMEYLPGFIQNLEEQSFFPQLEWVVVHNDPTVEETAVIEAFQSKYLHQVQHVLVSRETLGASWNRGCSLARGEFIAIWNIDDRREPDSLEKQVTTLQTKPQAVFTYGDYIETSKHTVRLGPRRVTPPFQRNLFRRALPHGGAFFVFRRSLFDTIGHFDEHYRIAVDMEFSLRIAVQGYRMARANGLMGYFTNEERGLSTREGAQPSAMERTATQLRYAIYDKVRWEYYREARVFRPDEIQVQGEWLPLTRFVPNIRRYRLLRMPLWSLAVIRNFARSLFQRLGILEIIYKLQKRYIRREL